MKLLIVPCRIAAQTYAILAAADHRTRDPGIATLYRTRSYANYVVLRKDSGRQSRSAPASNRAAPGWDRRSRMTQPYAADDFDAIRRRLMELRAERIEAPTEERRESSPRGPRPYHVSDAKHSRRQTDFRGAERDCDGPSPPMTLRAACKLVGCDRAGTRCTHCRLAARCVDDSRWLVRGRSRLV